VWGLENFFFKNLKKIEEKLIKCFTIFKLYFVYSIQKVKKNYQKWEKIILLRLLLQLSFI
jgi:hypothetical protein